MEILQVEPVQGTRPVMEIPIGDIMPNPNQPRRDFDREQLRCLRDSILRYGMLQPISVRASSAASGKYEIVAGERRYRAACEAGFLYVPAILIETDAQRSAELAIIENLQRQDLNIFEQASAISSLINIYHITQDEAAEKLSVSQSYVANKLRLLRFTDEERSLIIEHSLTERHARALLRLRDDGARLSALRHVIGYALNVSATERYVDSLLAASVPRPKIKFAIKNLRLFYNSVDRAADLIRSSGVPVDIRRDESAQGCVVMTVTIGERSPAPDPA